jgi:hypothetical protein
MPEDIPESISFSVLRQLHTEKATRFDFSQPSLGPAMGDLAFLISLYMKQKLTHTQSHQHIFLLDILATELRVHCDKMLTEMIEKGAPAQEIKTQAKVQANLSLIEAMLDGMVALFARKTGQGTKPSHQLIKSIDPSVLPHQVDDWLRDTVEYLR